jgi:cellulose synthase/poly-beta-1,6-N-acetylglucosamine synthase-like glycosyltransferase
VSSLDSQPLLASVIVPVFNGARTLDACLNALCHQTIDPGRYEVIVVDDGSTDGSAQVAARHEVTLIRQDHAGAAAARNQGARQARGSILAFTDADCEPCAGWIEQMLAPFDDSGVVGVKGVYRTRQSSLVARFAQAEYEEKYDRLARAEWIDFVDTYAAAFRRELFFEQGGFDPGFQFDEDQEFSFRLARAGYAMVFAPEAIVYHLHPSGLWSYARRKSQIGRWKVRVHLRHPAKAASDSYTPWTQKAQMALLPLIGGLTIAAIVGLVPWAVILFMAFLGMASTVPLALKAAQHGWPVALVTPALAFVRAGALVLGMGWGIVGLSRVLKTDPS